MLIPQPRDRWPSWTVFHSPDDCYCMTLHGKNKISGAVKQIIFAEYLAHSDWINFHMSGHGIKPNEIMWLPQMKICTHLKEVLAAHMLWVWWYKGPVPVWLWLMSHTPEIGKVWEKGSHLFPTNEEREMSCHMHKSHAYGKNMDCVHNSSIFGTTTVKIWKLTMEHTLCGMFPPEAQRSCEACGQSTCHPHAHFV